MKLPSTVIAALCVLTALVLVNYCGERRGARRALAKQVDQANDSLIQRTQWVSDSAQQVYDRLRDSTGREIRALMAKIAPRDTVRLQIADTAYVLSQLAARDSVIAELEAGRRADSLEILFWRAQTTTRDTLIAGLQRARDSYRREASKPRYVITDIGGGAIAGWGLAEKCSECVLVGAGVVLVPRLLGAARGLF